MICEPLLKINGCSDVYDARAQAEKVNDRLAPRQARGHESIERASEARRMAARLGLEPRQNESESFVLPLHHRAVGKKFCQRRGMEPAMGFEPATACLQNRCS